MSVTEIAAAVGLSHTTTWRRLKKAGVTLRDKHQAGLLSMSNGSPVLTRDAVYKVYTVEGNSVKESARVLGVNRETLLRFMRRVGIRRRMRSYSRYSESRYRVEVDDDALVYDYTVRGLGVRGVARKHGIGRDAARDRLVNRGVTIRPRGSRMKRDSAVLKVSCSKAA